MLHIKRTAAVISAVMCFSGCGNAADIGSENIITKEHPSMGVEDFAFYAAERPSAFFFVGTGYEGRKNYGIHHGKFEADESALDTAVQLEVLTALKLMNE